MQSKLRVMSKTFLPQYIPSFLFLLLICAASDAQVTYKIQLLSDVETYQVSLIPDVSWPDSEGITATAQVTLVVPTGGFEFADLQSIHGDWSNNSFVASPEENPSCDYISIGLSSLGTSDIPYVEGEETILFTFKNNGVCTGPIWLIDQTDPFFPPNSVSSNVSNQITTLGGGNINSWDQNFGIGLPECSSNAGECLNDEIVLCTPEILPVEVCPDFCNLNADYQLTNVAFNFNCTITLLPNNCFRYTPTPDLEGEDELIVSACDLAGNCDSAPVTIKVGDCEEENTSINDLDCDLQIIKAVEKNAAYVLEINNIQECFGNEKINFMIFNTNGQAVYQNTGTFNHFAWNGQTKEGQSLPNGLYYYQLLLNNNVLINGNLPLLK